jgi:tetratricopeptide (TPR) repeat protein
MLYGIERASSYHLYRVDNCFKLHGFHICAWNRGCIMISPEEQKVLSSFAERISQADPGAHNNLAIVYYNKGLYREAIEELEKALELNPNFVLARNNLEIILRKTGKLEEKVEQL